MGSETRQTIDVSLLPSSKAGTCSFAMANLRLLPLIRSFSLISTLLIVGCAPPPPKTVSMRVKGGMPDATVHIDDRYIGSFSFVKSRGVALPPGIHRISVERSGYFPWDVVVEVQEGDPPVHLDVVLQRIPD